MVYKVWQGSIKHNVRRNPFSCFTCLNHCPLWKEVRAETQGRNLETGTKAKSIEKFSWQTCSLSFLVHAFLSYPVLLAQEKYHLPWVVLLTSMIDRSSFLYGKHSNNGPMSPASVPDFYCVTRKLIFSICYFKQCVLFPKGIFFQNWKQEWLFILNSSLSLLTCFCSWLLVAFFCFALFCFMIVNSIIHSMTSRKSLLEEIKKLIHLLLKLCSPSIHYLNNAS